MRLFKSLVVWVLLFGFSVAKVYAAELSASEKPHQSNESEVVLGINTADVREDTSSVQFLNLFRTAIPFSETVPWGSSKKVKYDEYGWPTDLKGGQAGTKFLNRLPDNTVENGFFTVLYDGEGSIFYGNDARLVVHRANRDIIEISSGKDKILNASLFIKESNPENYVRNIRILPEGGICKGNAGIRVKSPQDCGPDEYLSFEDNHFNPWAKEQREQQQKEAAELVESTTQAKEVSKVVDASDKDTSDKIDKSKTLEKANNRLTSQDKFVIKGLSKLNDAVLFNPEYLNFMKDFQLIRFMNMSGMTRNPVRKWSNRNTLKKATWGGKYGSRGAPVEVMVALANEINAHAWFSMPYKASDDYIQQFGEYVSAHLESEIKTYIEYSNEVWNPIFIHHDYAIQRGSKARLDKKKSQAGYKWYSKRSVETFKIWEKAFSGTNRLVRVMGSWASNQIMSSTVLAYKDAYKYTDAIAIGPYVSAHPRVLRRAKTVDDIFKAMLDKKTKWGMRSTVNYIKRQAKVAKSYGVDLVAYEGGQHLVDWNTRKAEEHPNKLLYAANRDPRMGIIYDELMREWQRAGGKLFVAFSAPRIYSWYGSWGIKEHIRQARADAPKYDSLLRYLNTRLYPKQLPQPGVNPKDLSLMAGAIPDIAVIYAKTPQLIWDMSQPQNIQSDIQNNSPYDISANWQANWDSKHLYLSFAISDDDLQPSDQISLTLDSTSAAEDLAKQQEQEKRDIEIEKKLLAEKKKAKALRKIHYEKIAKAKKDREEAEEKAAEEMLAAKKSASEKSNEKSDKESKEEKSKNQQLTDDVATEAEKSVEEAFKQALKSTDKKKLDSDALDKVTNKNSKKELKEDVSIKAKDPEETKESKVVETKAEDKDKLSVSKANIPEKDSKEPESQAVNENVQTFTFSPFDELNSQSRMILTDTGYLLNVAIPWTEIYKKKRDVLAKSGDKLGINIVVSDSDKGEKGNKVLRSADTSIALPKIILKSVRVE